MAIVFTDMKMDPDEAKETLPCGPCDTVKGPVGPMYPWGLNVTLTDKELDKLGVTYEDMKSGGMVHLHSMAKITSTSSDERQDGTKSCRVELQLQQLAIENEDAENKEADKAPVKRRRSLYG